MKLHLGRKSKVCILLLFLGSSLALAQDLEVEDPFAAEALEVEESFQEDTGLSVTDEDPLSIPSAEAESQQFEEELQAEESIADEIEKSAPPLEDELQMAEPEESLIPAPPTEDEILAQDNNSTEVESTEGLVAVPATGLVEYEAPDDYQRPYRERRGNHGAYFGVEYEPTIFKSYAVEDVTYKDIFGDTVTPMLRLSFDYKLNTGVGAFSLGAFYSMGSVSGNLDTVNYSLSATRSGLGFRFALDQLSEEPYVVPYVGILGHQTSLKMETAGASITDNYPFATSWVLGAMFQLDWLDQSAAIDSRKVGIENTFLDIFATQYAAVNDPELANTETDMIFGAGLRVEF